MLVCLDQRTGTGCGTANRDGAQMCKQCGRPLRFALALQNPGAVIGGRYRVDRLIGHGGFGAVYQALDLQRSMPVAVKETFDAESIKSFRGEFDVLCHLHHANLPVYFDMLEAQGNGYLVMEFVPGQSLQEVLDKQQGAVLEAQVMGYALQICDALMYLHAQQPPIIHRDIKPANIRVTPEGLVKLVDFGLVKQGTGSTLSSRRGLTPAYAPIEQYGTVAGQHTDARSDVYALGATLYHLLSGQAPIPVLDRIATPVDPLIPVQQVNPRVSAPVAAAVGEALSVLQKDRCPDVPTLKRELVRVGAPPPPPPGPGLRPVVRTTRPLLWVALALVAVCGLTALGASQSVLRQVAGPSFAGAIGAPSYGAAFTIPMADPYARAGLAAIPANKAYSIESASAKTAQVVDLYLELANDQAGDVAVFISPFCSTPVLVGTAHLAASPSARPVWISAKREVLVSGRFCVQVQAEASVHVSIAQNQVLQPLAKVVVIYP